MRLSKEIKAKYRFSNNTFIRTVKDDWKDRISVEVGDSKQPDFLPQLKVMRWDNEVNLSFRLLDTEPKQLSSKGEKIKLVGPKKEVHFYELGVSEEHPENAFELEIVLKEKPPSNIIEFSLNTKGVSFYYQPELTQEEKDKGASRPENVVGSYAVYASENKINYVGGKEYKCGKVGHIFRPRIIDSKGNWVWGELNIEGETLSVTIPQDFLDKAVYPVRVDPTFGYTGSGASDTAVMDNYTAIGSIFDSPEMGTVDSMTVKTRISFGSTNVKTIICNSSKNIITNGASDLETFPSGGPFFDETTTTYYTNKPTIEASTSYYLMIVIRSYTQVYYDAGTTNQGLIDTSNNNTTPTDPTDGTANDNKYSIYCTYTAGGETQTKTVTSKARVKKLAQTKTIQAKANLKLLGISKSIQAKAKITEIPPADTKSAVFGEAIKGWKVFGYSLATKTVQAKSRIQQVGLTNTIQTKAFVSKTFTKTIQAKADIKKEAERTITAKSRIGQIISKSIQSKARTLKEQLQTIQSKALISTGAVTKTIQSKARLEKEQLQTVQAKARLVDTLVKTIQSKASVVVTNTKTAQAKARLKAEITQTLTAKARLFTTAIKTSQAKARIGHTLTKTITAQSRVKKAFSETIQALANVKGVVSQTIQAKAYIGGQAVTKTIQAKSRIAHLLTQTVTTKARVKKTIGFGETTSAVFGLAVKGWKIFNSEAWSPTKLSAKARVVLRQQATVQPKARIKTTSLQTITACCRLFSEQTKTIQAKACVVELKGKTIQAKARMKRIVGFLLSAKAYIVKFAEGAIVSAAETIEGVVNTKGAVEGLAFARVIDTGIAGTRKQEGIVMARDYRQGILRADKLNK